MSLDMAMIVIAVSKYSEYGATFSDVPTLESAEKIVRWASEGDRDSQYKVLHITDEKDPVTVARIRENVDKFLTENFIDRLIVYFAGHGFSTTEGEQHWALSRFVDDNDECISVPRSMDSLGTYGFGRDNNDIDYGQICIISDACRNVGNISYRVRGAKLCNGAKVSEPTDNEYDVFYSTKPKGYSLAKREDVGKGELPFTLFSQCLVEALNGEHSEAIEWEYHPDAPAVTNEKLKLYLKKTVLKRSLEIDPNTPMKPEINTNISARHNVYKKLSNTTVNDEHHDTVPDTNDDFIDGNEDITFSNDLFKDLGVATETFSFEAKSYLKSHAKNTSFRSMKDSVRHGFENVMKIDRQKSDVSNFLDEFRFKDDKYSLQLAFDQYPEAIGYRSDQTLKVRGTDFGGVVANTERNLNDHFFTRFDINWTVIPKYRNTVSFVSSLIEHECLLYAFDLPELKNGFGKWEHLYSEHYSQLVDLQMSSSQALSYADRIREQKEIYPHLSVIAGRKYIVAGDYDNILRTAHYMAISHTDLPFDLALQCAQRIYWKRSDGYLCAYADLPAVKKTRDHQGLQHIKKRPYFAETEFDENHDVRLAGLFPVFSSGWQKLLDRPRWEIPENILSVAREIKPSYLTEFDNDLADQFFETFDYRVKDLT